MRLRQFVGLVCLGVAAAATAQEKKETEADKKKAALVKKDQQRLQGTWEVVDWIVDGEALPKAEVKAMRVVFKGDSMTLSMPKGEAKREYTFTLDPTQKPKAIDTSQRLDEFKQQIATPGIYELEGNTLKLCLARPGGSRRPQEMESTATAGTILIVLKRGK